MRRFLLLAVAAAAAAGTAWPVTASAEKTGFRSMRPEQRKAAWESLRRRIQSRHAAFPGNAGIIVKDLSSGWEIAINREQVFPAASMVKIPIMAGCFQAIEEGHISLDTEVRLTPEDVTPGSGKLKAQEPGSVYTVEQLIELMVAESDNTATNMLIDKLTPEYLNRFFSREGLRSTCLRRKMMDFSRRKQGVENYTSSDDIAVLLERMYRGGCVNAKASAKCIEILLMQKMKDRIPKKLPKDTPVAHKTGLEKNVCHDAGVVYTPEGDFLICVLTKSRAKGGYQAMKDFIAKTALAVYNTYQTGNAGQEEQKRRRSQKYRSRRSPRKGG